jgi:hypothetical protein
MVLFFFSGDSERLVCLVVAVMVVYISLFVCILLVLCCLYAYQLCIAMFMNTSNVCLRAYIVKKNCPNCGPNPHRTASAVYAGLEVINRETAIKYP